MRYLSAITRTAAAAVLLAGVVAAPTAAQASTTQRFHAESGDNCHYGQTDGTLTWGSTLSVVAVAGSLIDRPLPTDPGPACPDDRRVTIANFTAYAGTTVVDREQQAVDNGRLDFQFRLGDDAAVARISEVVVQVCRASLSSTSPIYCGPAQRYTPITTTP